MTREKNASPVEVSVVIPCFNEERVVRWAYEQISRSLSGLDRPFEIVFANDGSTDGTAELLHDIEREDTHVRVLDNPVNRGLGAMYSQLYHEARGQFVIQMDADLSTGPEIIPALLAELEKADVVVASRYAGLEPVVPLSRRIPSRIYNVITRMLFGITVRDTQTGFVGFRKEFITDLVVESHRFTCHIEILVKLLRRGARMVEIPVEYVHRSKGSKFSMLEDGPRTLYGTVKLWWRLRKTR